MHSTYNLPQTAVLCVAMFWVPLAAVVFGHAIGSCDLMTLSAGLQVGVLHKPIMVFGLLEESFKVRKLQSQLQDEV